VTPGLARLVGLARRRMRVNRVLAVLGPVLVLAGAAGVAWLVVSRALPVPDLDRPVAAGLVAAVVLAALAGAVVRIPARWAAWAADRWLGSADAYATAV
jgi:hypothetical protein